MAIVKMDKVTVVGLHEQRDDIIDTLMRLGAVELISQDRETDTSDDEKQQSGQLIALDQPIDEKDDLTQARQKAEQSAVNLLTRLEMAIETSDRLCPVKKKMFSGRRSVDSTTLMRIADREEALLDVVGRLEQNNTRLTEHRMQIGRLQARRELLLPWRTLDLDLSSPGTTHVQMYLGTFDTPDQVTLAETQLHAEVPESMISVLAEDEGGQRCAVATLRSRADLVRSLLRRVGFNALPDIETAGTAAEQLGHLDRDLQRTQLEITELEKENMELAQYGPDLELLHDFLMIRHDRLKASSSLETSQHTFWLQGWVPSHLVHSVEKGLQSRYLVAVSHQRATRDDDYPILFRNNRLVKPYEVIVEMFSAPSTREKDPTPLMAPFFFFFFGMMLSDIGYGLLLSGLCALLIFKVKSQGEMGRMARMLFLCGISSIIWGIIFGSFFGDMIAVLSQQRLILKPLWFNPMDDATLLMVWSMIFGVVHLFAGMGAKAYLLFLTGRAKDAILDIFPWYLIIIGAGLTLGRIAAPAGQVMAITGVAVLILFGGRDAKNPLMRFLKGLLSLYDITGYISDILSYTRILALVLATSVIAMVVNLLGFLGGPSITGFFFYIVVAVAGHGLNLALSSLSAYVHTSRLQYVEFFSKFYEGGGRIWRPLTIKTRYVDLVRSSTDQEARQGS